MGLPGSIIALLAPSDLQAAVRLWHEFAADVRDTGRNTGRRVVATQFDGDQVLAAS